MEVKDLSKAIDKAKATLFDDQQLRLIVGSHTAEELVKICLGIEDISKITLSTTPGSRFLFLGTFKGIRTYIDILSDRDDFALVIRDFAFDILEKSKEMIRQTDIIAQMT